MKSTKTSSLSKAVRDYLAGLGRRGGSSTSKAKAAASRRNGCKGGRPRLALCKRCRWIHDMRCPLTADERYLRIHDPSCRFGPRCKLYEDVRTFTSVSESKAVLTSARKARPSKQKKKA